MKLEFDTKQAVNRQDFVSSNDNNIQSGGGQESLMVSVIDDMYKQNEDMIGGSVKSMLPTFLFMYTIKTARLLYYEKYDKEKMEYKCEYYHTMLVEQVLTVLVLVGLTIVDNMELFYILLFDSVISTLILMFKKQYREYTLVPFFMIY